MEEDDKTWEEYFFKDVPEMGVIPLLVVFSDDLKLSKLAVLEKLNDKI